MGPSKERPTPTLNAESTEARGGRAAVGLNHGQRLVMMSSNGQTLMASNA